jgi:hypothetical protein
MNCWMTIDSAPKDGREIVAVATTFRGPVMLRWSETAKHGEGWYDWDLDKPHAATHWFELPEQPAVR